jgi:hypothetical protein
VQEGAVVAWLSVPAGMITRARRFAGNRALRTIRASLDQRQAHEVDVA